MRRDERRPPYASETGLKVVTMSEHSSTPAPRDHAEAAPAGETAEDSRVNVGVVDAVLRVVLGVGMLSMIYFVPESGYWGLLGLMPLWTAVTRRCHLYSVFGWRTTRRPLVV